MIVPPSSDVSKTESTVDAEQLALPEVQLRKQPFSRENENVEPYITGWRLHVLTLVLCVCVFIAQMESTVTSTSVITITDDLGGFVKNSWILTAYWLTSGAFQIIWAKLSDIVGRKVAMMSAIFVFTTFSGACGGSQSVVQLIMFRWVQGIGGCGVLVLGQLIFFDILPPKKYVPYTTLVTSVITFSLIGGPLIGGGITLHGLWRWVFLVNVPIGVCAMLTLAWLFPRPLWNEPAAQRNKSISLFRHIFERLDILGTILLVGACLLLTTGLEQAAIGYSFSSPFVLPLLICSGPFCIAFFTWQWYITTKRSRPEPMFPWRFCQSRVRVGLILTSWLSGGVVSTCVFQIPQRFMTANGLSPFDAAARLLVFGAPVVVGSGLTGILLGRLKLRPVLVIAAGAALQLIGAALLARSSLEYHVHASQYAYQVLIGLGLGLVMPALIYLLPYTMEKQDLAVGTAAVSQFRILGGLIAVAIGASVTTRHLTSHLGRIMAPESLQMVLQRTESLHFLQPEVAARARELFGQAYNIQMDLGTGFAAAQFVATFLMWTRENPGVQDRQDVAGMDAE